MKTTFTFLLLIIAVYGVSAQNTTVDPKGTPTTNQDLPSNIPLLEVIPE